MLSRRGARRIVVDGHALLWWVRRRGVRGCPDCDECSVVLAAATRTGQIVRVWIADPWRDDVEPITPTRVAALARKALARGWIPGAGDGLFLAVNDLPPPAPDPAYRH